MRLKTNIFNWVFLAAMVPLTMLALGATYYSEYTYLQKVREEVQASLASVSTELQRNLQGDRRMALGLTRTPQMQSFIQELAVIAAGQVPAVYGARQQQLEDHFNGLRAILPEAYYLRVLDHNGNTLLRVNQEKASAPVYESLNGVRYVEQEINQPGFVRRLHELPRGEVSVISLPHNHLNPEELLAILPIHDYVVPLYVDEHFVGAFTATLFGDQIDRILEHAPRLYKGQLNIIEYNPEKTSRHGLLLYDDQHQLHFSQVRPEAVYAQKYYGSRVLEAVSQHADGVLEDVARDIQEYFVEFYPYPNQLVSWVISLRISKQAITEPFTQIRWVIWVCAVLALVFSLILANIGARSIARPVGDLSSRLLDYANGEHRTRVHLGKTVDEVNELGKAFNYMADTLDSARAERDQAERMLLQSAKLASIGEMAAGIGHEINNPLNNILSYAKLVERSLTEEQARARQDIKSLREEALRASDIVKGILNFARQMPAQYSRFDVPGWLENTLTLVQQMARAKGIQLILENYVQDEIEGDRGQLQQALVNLLLNAIQASPRDSHIHILADEQDGQLVIKIQDQGEGIASAALDKIFDPFFTTKAEGEGSGLGLSIALGIIEHHNGHLRLENQPAGGVTATVQLPLGTAKHD
ncbi:MAG: HAMP domain-containing sensor histidine kinase [Gammaproteobacteria bacterium]